MEDVGDHRETLERVSDGVVSLDGDLRYTYVNSKAERLLGLERDALLGRSVWDVFGENVKDAAQEHIEGAIETGTLTTFERYNADLERWFDVRIYPDDDGVTILFTDVSESKADTRKLERILETTPVGVAILDEEGAIVRANGRAEQLLGLHRSDIEGRRYDHPEWDIWDESGAPIPPAEHPVNEVLRTGRAVHRFVHGITLPDGIERWLSSNTALVRDESGTIENVVVALEDITTLKRLERLIETFQPVDDVLNRASSRTETEQEVCDLLIASEQYDLAWIADYTPGTTHLEPHVRSGPEATYLDDITIPLTDSSTEDGPSRRAVETGEIQVVTDLQSDPRFEHWREQATEHGLRGSAAVPLVHDEQVHGVLGLYTRREGAFETREQRLLSTLGRRIGQVLHALETETLLHAESVVELTFESTDSRSFLVEASTELDCEIVVHSSIPTGEESLLRYVETSGAPPEAVAELAETVPEIEETRQVRAGAESGLLELLMQRRSLAHTLVTAGAVVTSDRVVDGRAEVVCELSTERSIPDLVSRLTAAFPETELVAKREYNRSPESMGVSITDIATVFENDLTDRQRQAIRAAFHAGYFESPRRSTGSEIAKALSMTQSTFAYHLRNAQRTLFERLFDRL